jgi:hypothetical protein
MSFGANLKPSANSCDLTSWPAGDEELAPANPSRGIIEFIEKNATTLGLYQCVFIQFVPQLEPCRPLKG